MRSPCDGGVSIVAGFLAEFHAEVNDSQVMSPEHYKEDAERLLRSLIELVGTVDKNSFSPLTWRTRLGRRELVYRLLDAPRSARSVDPHKEGE